MAKNAPVVVTRYANECERVLDWKVARGRRMGEVEGQGGSGKPMITSGIVKQEFCWIGGERLNPTR
jgi:hypothetical protein